MKKRFAFLVTILVAVLLVAFIFAGCQPKYNAELINSAQNFLQDDFRNANTTYIDSSGVSTSHSHLITNKQGFDQAFKDYFPRTIDFSKKIVLIYFFTVKYSYDTYKLEKISVKKNNISVEIKRDKKGIWITSEPSYPHQIALVVIMDSKAINDKSSATVNFKDVS
jgi:hypothetical protein